MTKLRAHSADLREMPAYTITEAAHYMNMPRATTRYWASGQGMYPSLITAAGRHPTLLSFLNLVELHVLAAIRREHTLPMPKVRAAIDWLVNNTKDPADKHNISLNYFKI